MATKKARPAIIFRTRNHPTGMSGSGKGSVLRALEDLGYYSVDNLSRRPDPEVWPTWCAIPPPPACGARGRMSAKAAGLKKIPCHFQGNSRCCKKPA